MRGTTEITIEIPLEIKFDGQFDMKRPDFHGTWICRIDGKDIEAGILEYIDKHYFATILNAIREEMK